MIAERFGEQFGDRQGPRLQDQGRRAPRRPTSRSARPRSRATPSRFARMLKSDQYRLYRLIWQRALASQMAPKELETTTAELVGGPYRLRASATRTLFDGFAARLHRGPGRRRGRGGRAPAARRCARATSRRVGVGHPDPALHRAAAALHRGDPDQGARGARDRPPVDVRRHDLDDRRPRLRPVDERRLHPEEIAEIVTDLLVDHFGEYVDLAFTARMEEELDEVAARRARVGPAAARVLRAAQGAGRREAQASSSASDFTTEETDEVCSEGHPMVIRLGRNGKFLACSQYPEHKETRPLPGEETADPRGRRRDVPPVRRGDAPDAARPVTARSSAARATRTARSSRTRARRPRTSCRSRSPAPRTPTATWSPVARGAPGTSSGGAPPTRSATSRPTTSRPAPSTTPTMPLHADGRGSVARQGDAGMCMTCGAIVELPDGDAGRAAASRVARRTRRRSSGRRAARGRGGARRATDPRAVGGRRAHRLAARRAPGTGSRRTSA